jgi:hypothetical protein
MYGKLLCFDGVSVARCVVDRCLPFFLLTIVLSILVPLMASDYDFV